MKKTQRTSIKVKTNTRAGSGGGRARGGKRVSWLVWGED